MMKEFDHPLLIHLPTPVTFRMISGKLSLRLYPLRWSVTF